MKPTAPAITLFALALLGLVAIVALPFPTPVRALTIDAPVYAPAHSSQRIEVTASTRTEDGEWVEFLQVECSTDGGETWDIAHYSQSRQPEGSQVFQIETEGATTDVLVRARAAFRGGAAGDVDFQGQPVDWAGTWSDWDHPPAVSARIHVE